MKTAPLRELVKVTMGTAPDGATYNSEGDGLPLLAGAGDFGEISPRAKKWTTAPSAIAQSGDLLLCVRATIGDLNWADADYCLGRGVAGLRAYEGKADIKYIAHVLAEKKSELMKLGNGSTFVAIRRGHVEEFPIPDTVEEQRRIAAILNRANTMRRKRQEAQALTDAFLRATFLDLFGDPATNPKGWPLVSLEGLIVDGPTNGLYKPSGDYGSGTPIIRIDSFHRGQIASLDRLKRLRTTDQENERFAVVEGDVLINRVNSLSHLAKTAVVPALEEPTVYESNMMRLRINQSQVLPLFLNEVLQSGLARRHFLSRAKNAVNQSSINQTDVREFAFPLPPLDLQERFARAFHATQAERARMRAHRAEIEALTASLQAQMFSV